MPPTLKHLPALEGFYGLEESEKGKIRVIDETYIMSFLEKDRFRTGPALSRALANLTVLLRLLLFYADLPQRGTDFWRHMSILWDVCDVCYPQFHLKNLVEHYVYSRKKFLNAFGEGRSQGLLIRLVDEWSKFHEVPMAPQRVVDWDARRDEWVRLRDKFVEVLFDSKQPLRMVGVPPTITKWMNTYDDKTLSGMVVSPSKQSDVTASGSSEEKHKYTINTRQQTARMEGKMAKKRKRQEAGFSVDIKSQTAKEQKVKEEDSQPNWRVELQLAVDKMSSRSEEVKARLHHETSGFVPSLQRPAGDGSGHAMEQSMHFSVPDVKIMALEKRLAELEGRVTAESRWSRSMGAFLYDANQKTLETMGDVMGVFGVVKGMVEKVMSR